MLFMIFSTQQQYVFYYYIYFLPIAQCVPNLNANFVAKKHSKNTMIMNRSLEASFVIEHSWSVFKAHWVGLTGILLLVMVVSSGVAYLNPYQVPTGLTGDALINWYVDNGVAYYGFVMLASGVQVALMAWFYKEVLLRIKDKEPILNASVVLRYVAVSIIVGIATYASLLCCIIPVFFIAPRLIIAPLYVIDNPNMSVGEAIERSWKATRGNVVPLLVLGVTAIIISLIGVLCCIVGIVPASVLCNIIMVVAYLFLSGQLGDTIDPANDYEEEVFVVEEKTVCR